MKPVKKKKVKDINKQGDAKEIIQFGARKTSPKKSNY